MRRPLLLLTAALAALAAASRADAGRLRGMSWVRGDETVGDATLALGVPGTDEIFLKFQCAPHSGAIRLVVVAEARDGAAVELRSGKLKVRHTGAGEADEETDGAYDIQLQLSADDPVLRHVADTGDLTVVLGRRRVQTPNAFSPFHDFLDVCRR